MIIITGAAGFIGFHLSKKLLSEGHRILGIDNLNDYYDVNLKKERLKLLKETYKGSDLFKFIKCDLKDSNKINNIFKKNKPKIVINLAAQAGVRYSIENPKSYIDSNLVGFGNILECCRTHEIEHLIFASSSSVYGGNRSLPFKEDDGVNHPVSLYAATKRANELMAHTYSHLYKLPTTGLRFFTVYGPWGRPDMGYFIFTSKILKGETIKIFNNGDMMRDFTYIDDIVDGIKSLIYKSPTTNNNFDLNMPKPSESWAPFKLFNLGNSTPIKLMSFIKTIEEALGLEAKKEFLPMQMGDVEATYADMKLLDNWINFKPKTTIKKGIGEFTKWYLKYYKI